MWVELIIFAPVVSRFILLSCEAEKRFNENHIFHLLLVPFTRKLPDLRLEL